MATVVIFEYDDQIRLVESAKTAYVALCLLILTPHSTTQLSQILSLHKLIFSTNTSYVYSEPENNPTDEETQQSHPDTWTQQSDPDKWRRDRFVEVESGLPPPNFEISYKDLTDTSENM